MKKLIVFVIVASLFASCVTKTVTTTHGRGKHKTTKTTVKKHTL